MSRHHPLGDRDHALEFQKMLGSWVQLRRASQASVHVLARYEPPDAQTLQAREIVAALREHGRAAARFVAGLTGGSDSMAVLWWVDSQLADDFSRDNESAGRFDEVRLILDNALIQA